MTALTFARLVSVIRLMPDSPFVNSGTYILLTVEGKIPHPADQIRQDIGLLLRDKDFLAHCNGQSPKDVRALVTELFRQHAVPVHAIKVGELPFGQGCRYFISYTLDLGGERQAQRFCRRAASGVPMMARQKA